MVLRMASGTNTAVDLVALASSPPVTCRSDTSVADAARRMHEQAVGFVVVVDGEQHAAGVITDRDIVVRSVARECDPSEPVSSVMSREVVAVRSDATVADAARQMAVRGCRRLPVVNPDGRVLGVLSADDLYCASSAVLVELDRVFGRGRTRNR